MHNFFSTRKWIQISQGRKIPGMFKRQGAWCDYRRGNDNWEPDHRGLAGHCEDVSFYSEKNGEPWKDFKQRSVTLHFELHCEKDCSGCCIKKTFKEKRLN